MVMAKRNEIHGFSLVELVTVIILLGVLSVGISSFIQFGSQTFVETSGRDQLISSARFAVERINRDLRQALPNSLRVLGKPGSLVRCLEYKPIIASTIYQDIPVLPEPANNQIEVIKFDDSNFSASTHVAVYPLDSNEAFGTAKIKALSAVAIDKLSDPKWLITLSLNTSFSEDSPTNRAFFIAGSVSYCVDTTRQLRRFQGYNSYLANGAPDGDGILMAENIRFLDDSGDVIEPFTVVDASLQRNAQVINYFNFTLFNDTENIIFNNEIQVPNVP